MIMKMLFLRSGGATRPLRRGGAWSNSTETQQLGHAPRSGLEFKSGRSSAKMVRWRVSDAGHFRRRWVTSCRGRPQALQEEFSFRFVEDGAAR